MYSTDNTLLFGYGNLMIITSNDRTYQIDKQVYRNALINCPSNFERFAHSISPTASLPGDQDEVISMIIYFIHCASLPIREKKFAALTIANIHKLVNALGIIDWCGSMIKSSTAYENYKSAVKQSIQFAIDIVRAIVAKDSNCIGGVSVRLELLKKCELPITISRYITEWILLPCTPQDSDKNKKMKEWKVDTIRNISKQQSSEFKVDYNGCFKCDTYRVFSNIIFSKECILTVTGADIIAKQDELLTDILSREMRIMCYEKPDYLKLPAFNDCCKRTINQLFDYNELVLHCASKPKMTICDVFQFGLAGALTADYV